MARSFPQLFSPAIRTAAPHPMPTSVLAYVAVALVVEIAAAADDDDDDDNEAEDSGLLDSGVETGRVMMSGASAVWEPCPGVAHGRPERQPNIISCQSSPVEQLHSGKDHIVGVWD